jgi:hypothetical protein
MDFAMMSFKLDKNSNFRRITANHIPCAATRIVLMLPHFHLSATRSTFAARHMCKHSNDHVGKTGGEPPANTHTNFIDIS